MTGRSGFVLVKAFSQRNDTIKEQLMRSRYLSIFAVAAILGASSLHAQGSGTTTTKSTTTKASGKSYHVTKSVSGKVVSNEAGTITVKVGSKTRRFAKNNGTKNAGASLIAGQQVKIFYKSSSPGTATEIR